MYGKFFATLFVGAASLAPYAWGQNSNCVSPVPPGCISKVPCVPERPRDVPPETPRDVPPEETGVYVAPPRTGALQGPTRRLGIQGMSITFPGLKLTAPHLEFPNLVRSHTEARMIIDQAQAPYVHTGYTAAQAPREAPREAPPEAPRDVPRDCEEELREMREKYEKLENRAVQLEQLLEQHRNLMERTLERGPGSCTGQSPKPAVPGSQPIETLPPRSPNDQPPPPPPGRTQIEVAPNPVTPAAFNYSGGDYRELRANVVREPVRTPALMRLPPTY